MKSELKKICNETYIKLLVILFLILAIAAAILPINGFQVFESQQSTEMVGGKRAISIMKQQFEQEQGALSIKKINETLTYYQSISSNDEAYFYSGIKYPGRTDLLINAYQPANNVAYTDFYKLKNANDFYNRNVVQIEKLFDKATNEYQSWEKKPLLERVQSIETPYQLAFSEQWRSSLNMLMILFILMAVSAIMIGSRLFSYEKEKHMDLILTTLGKNTLQQIGRKKLFALCTIISALFFISTLIFTIIFFSITGLDAWSSQIQIQYFTSIYHLTFGEAYLLVIFMGWFCLLAIGVLVATLNAFLQKGLLSVLIGVVVVFIPLLITKIGVLPIWIKKLFSVQPINGCLPEDCLLSLHLYRFFFTDVLATTAIIINAFIILIVCLLIAPRIFRARINQV